MDRPRDSQRSKLYAAETVLDEHQVVTVWNGVEVTQAGGTIRVHPGSWTLKETQAFVDRVVGSAWWKKRSPIHRVVVADGRGSSSARAYRSRLRNPTYPHAVIAVPIWARHRRVVLHELAHHLTPVDAAAHGDQFAANLIDLVRRFMSREDADRLTEAFRLAKVYHRPD